MQDQLGREVNIPHPPRRIVSLVPSQTELLYDLGLEEEVAGITKFCIHPDSWFRSKTRVGGTKQLDFEKIAALQPDLIIGNKEENDREQVEALMQQYNVWMSDITTLPEACDMIRRIGVITGRAEKAETIAAEITARFNRFKQEIAARPVRRVAYFIWKNPWMAAGRDTFIDHLLRICRLENVFAQEASRYPEVTLDQLKNAAPELVLLSSEPYPFKEKHIPEMKAILPGAEVRAVDGEMFSWYGSRLLQAPGYLGELFAE